MPSRSAWAGWIAFAGLLMIVLGFIDFFEGLIAVIRKEYYVAAPNQIIVFNVSTWGWLTLLWGIVLAFVGLGLLNGSSWARWVSIVVIVVTIFEQLAFLGSAAYPLWALTVLVLSFIVLYALVARWHDAQEAAGY
jgi:hypothetical protein